MPSIPELAIIDLFNGLVDRIKQSKPSTTTGKPTGGDIVYSQLLLGMPIDPEDYARPWSPIGGAVQATAAQAATAQTAGVPAVAGQPAPALLLALEAAFHTSQLCNLMLQVTDDGSYLEYPVGRHLAFQYTGLVDAMTPMPTPPLPAAEQAALDAAMNVLYVQDTTDPANPVIVGKTQLYQTYESNARKYAQAKANYAIGQAQTLVDPAKANLWPMISSTYQEAVDDAWNDWKTEGADKIEAALAEYESQGVNMQQAQIAAAKKQLDIWSLGLAGVPTDIPYSYVDPSAWCDPDNDDIGFEQLQIKRTSEDHLTTSKTDSNGSMWWNDGTSSLSQSGHAGFLIFGSGSESTSNADQHTASANASSYVFNSQKTDHFTDFEIDLEWGLVTIYRPWLISDLFYMNNWYIPGERADCVSDGKIQTQVKSNAPMLPMIPQQMLVVRNVSIKSSTWGDTANTLNTLYNGASASSDATQASQGGSAGASFGPISFGGSVAHASTTNTGKNANYSNASNLTRSTANFDGTTLSINGAQIIAFVSDIVPPSPTIDDPSLPKPKANNTNNTIAGPASATATPPATAGARGGRELTSMTTTSDLMQDVYANFLGAYAGQTAQGNIIVAFEPLGIMPGLDPAAPGAAAAALEFLSVNADWLPDLSSGSYDATGRTISGTYNLIVNASSPAAGVDATTFNLLKSSANEMIENGKAGSQLGAYTYFPTFASPANWFDTQVQTNWTSYSYVAGKPATPAPTPTPTPVFHPPYRMLMSPAWRLTANATPVADIQKPPPPPPPAPTPVAAHAMIMRSAMMVRPQFRPQVLQVHPTPAAASLVINNTGPTPALQPEFTITFDYCLMQLRRPWLSGDFLAAANWYIAGAHAGDYASGPVAATSAVGAAAPTSGNATATTPTATTTPAPAAAATPPFSWIPVACIAIKNLVIDAGGGALDPSVTTSATAFGPFAFRPQPGTSDKLSNPGVQIVAWVCRAQPQLPPLTDPALLPPPPVSTAETAATIVSTAAGIIGGLLGKGG